MAHVTVGGSRFRVGPIALLEQSPKFRRANAPILHLTSQAMNGANRQSNLLTPRVSSSAAHIHPAPLENSTNALPPFPPVIPDHELIRRIGGGSYGEVWLARN